MSFYMGCYCFSICFYYIIGYGTFEGDIIDLVLFSLFSMQR